MPLEAMVSDAAMEKFEDHVRRQAEPVHAEDLIPVARNDPRIQGPAPGNGEVLPKVPVRRRVIPAPFRRPSIHIDHHGKSWQVRHAESVKAGDIVPDVGRVAAAELKTLYRRRIDVLSFEEMGPAFDPLERVAAGLQIVLTGIDGREHIFEPTQRVHVFTAAEEHAGASAD